MINTTFVPDAECTFAGRNISHYLFIFISVEATGLNPGLFLYHGDEWTGFVPDAEFIFFVFEGLKIVPTK